MGVCFGGCELCPPLPCAINFTSAYPFPKCRPPQRLFHKAESLFYDCAAFVNDEEWGYALRFEPVACHRSTWTRRFFVVAVTQIYVLFGHEALFDEFVNGLNGGKERVFAVHCASAVHFAVNDGCAERGIFPITADCGNDVLVRHKHERTSGRFAAPLVKKYVAADFDFLASLFDVGKFLVENLVESLEVFVTAICDGGALNEFYKTVNVSVLVFHIAPRK